MTGPWPDQRLRERARAHLSASAELKSRVAAECLDSVLEASRLAAAAFRSSGKLLLCGNGGSAADCQHVAAELVSHLTREFDRPPLAAIALTTDTSLLTAHANDVGFEHVFSRQVEALGVAGDVLFAISTSGSSPNVLKAVEVARARNLRTVALTGAGGRLAQQVECAIVIPSRHTMHVQEAMLAIEHIFCDLIEQALFVAAD